MSFPTLSVTNESFAVNNGSIGVKVNPVGRLLVTANLLFRMNNSGLRQDVTPLIGLSYTFE